MASEQAAHVDAVIDQAIRDYETKPYGGGVWNYLVGVFLCTPLARIVCPERKKVYDRVWERRASLKAVGKI